MTDSPKGKVHFFLRSAWSKWLAFFLLLGMLASPFAWNYWVIKQIENQGGTVLKEPGILSGFLSEEQREWIETEWGKTVLSPFDQATRVTFTTESYSEKEERNRVVLKPTARLRRLQNLALVGCDIDEKELRLFSHLESYTSINTQMTNAGLGYLLEANHIKELYLFDSSITDQGLVHLKKNPELTALILSHSQISNQGLKHLERLQKLTFLDLSGTDIDDEGMEHLKKIKNLEHLYLSKTSITDEGLLQLQELKKLTTLSLSQTKISNPSLTYLKSFPKLKNLSIRWTQIKLTEEDQILLQDLADATDLKIRQLKTLLPDSNRTKR